MDKQELEQYVDAQIANHIHDGNFAQRIDFPDIFLYTEPLNVWSDTIATTGNTDCYFIAPRDMVLFQVDFSATSALSASDTNYITWTITNLGQDGTGTASLLGTETTQATGGSAISANTKRSFSLTSTLNDLQLIEGDRIRIRAAATGTLANTVTFPNYLLIMR